MIPKFAGAVCVFVIAFLAFVGFGHFAHTEADRRTVIPVDVISSASLAPPPPPTGFAIVSGPQSIGRDEFYVLREKTTGAVFVYSTRSSGGVFLMPLPR